MGWGKMPEVLDILRRQIFGNLVLVVNCQQHYHDQYHDFQQHDDNDEENEDYDDAIDDVGQRTDGIPRPTER